MSVLKLLIIVILLIVIINLFVYEHFTAADNNLNDCFNPSGMSKMKDLSVSNIITTNELNSNTLTSDNLNVKDLNVSNSITFSNLNFQNAIYKYGYPVGSIWISSKLYNPYNSAIRSFLLNHTQMDNKTNLGTNMYFYNFYGYNNNKFEFEKGENPTNTPLAYGTWMLMNYSGHNPALGLKKLDGNYNDEYYGWRYIKHNMIDDYLLYNVEDGKHMYGYVSAQHHGYGDITNQFNLPDTDLNHKRYFTPASYL